MKKIEKGCGEQSYIHLSPWNAHDIIHSVLSIHGSVPCMHVGNALVVT